MLPTLFSPTPLLRTLAATDIKSRSRGCPTVLFFPSLSFSFSPSLSLSVVSCNWREEYVTVHTLEPWTPDSFFLHFWTNIQSAYVVETKAVTFFRRHPISDLTVGGNCDVFSSPVAGDLRWSLMWFSLIVKWEIPLRCRLVKTFLLWKWLSRLCIILVIELPTSIQKNFFKCFIDVVFVLFLIEGKCKVSLNQQHGIYDNGKALPQVYRERVLDLYHQGSTQRQISQDMRVSIGYVNKVVQFYEQSNSYLPAPGCWGPKCNKWP